MDLKSGTQIHLVQKERVGIKVWYANDGSAAKGTCFEIVDQPIGEGKEIAVEIGISRPVAIQEQAYSRAKLPNVGWLISFVLPNGLGQQNISGGECAAVLAEQVSNHLRIIKAEDPDAVVHIFAVCPKAFLFFLG